MAYPWQMGELKAAFTPLGIDVREELGEGAHKVAYRAQVGGTERALKVVRPGGTGSPQRAERVRREIDAMLTVTSPYLAALYDVGTVVIGTEIVPYWVEELICGEDLTVVIARGPMQWDRASEVVHKVSQAASALAAAKIVHRDIKPSNIRLCPDECPKLLDLGIARHLNLPSETSDHAVFGPGTPMYSAPEQIRNQKRLIGERTDQFALGIVFYELLTGKYPFDPAPLNLASEDLRQAILTVNPRPPSSLEPAVPKPLDRVALRMMAKHPSGRYRNFAMLRAELQAAR